MVEGLFENQMDNLNRHKSTIICLFLGFGTIQEFFGILIVVFVYQLNLVRLCISPIRGSKYIVIIVIYFFLNFPY